MSLDLGPLRPNNVPARATNKALIADTKTVKTQYILCT
jgi:hypothetical protein